MSYFFQIAVQQCPTVSLTVRKVDPCRYQAVHGLVMLSPAYLLQNC